MRFQARRLDVSIRRNATDAGQLRAIDALVVLGKVAVEKAEANRPDNP